MASSNKEITPPKIMQALDWAYEKAVNGVPGLDTAGELANSYMNGDGSLEDKVNRLIRWQNTKSATSGFIAGLGGIVTMPVAIPANITSVIFIQIRMIAAIALMGEHDLKDDKVRTLVYASLCGSAVKDILKNVGINFGTKLTTKMIEKYVTREVINQINKLVGFRLVTKFGERGIINMGKMVPLVGGVVGGSFDAVMTNTVGNTARDIFITNE